MTRAVSDERGSILLLTALSLTAFVALVGISVDIGHVLLEKRKLQAAADAAAMAGAIEVRLCGGVTNCQTMQSAVQSAVSENNINVSTTLTNCSGTAGSGVTLTVNNPVCEVSTDPNKGKGNYVEAVLSEPVNTYFARLVGINSFNVNVRAEAAHGLGGPCIYALDSSGAALSILAGVIVKSNCGVVDESSSSNAINCVVGAFLYAPIILDSGGTSGLLCLASAKPRTHVPAPTPRDPLAYLPAPPTASDSCGTTTSSPYSGSPSAVNVILGGNVTFNPGVYCGGISITAALASTITFNPGTYVLKDGTGLLGITQGGLNITLNTLSTISGSDVMFYNEGPSGGFSVTEPVSGGSVLSLSTIQLSAPTSGDYGGVLFFQEHGVTSTGAFLANLAGTSHLNGAIYLPDAQLSYGVTALASSYNILVAKDINLNVAVASSFGNDYSTLEDGSPLNGDNDVLVE